MPMSGRTERTRGVSGFKTLPMHVLRWPRRGLHPRSPWSTRSLLSGSKPHSNHDIRLIFPEAVAMAVLAMGGAPAQPLQRRDLIRNKQRCSDLYWPWRAHRRSGGCSCRKRLGRCRCRRGSRSCRACTSRPPLLEHTLQRQRIERHVTHRVATQHNQRLAVFEHCCSEGKTQRVHMRGETAELSLRYAVAVRTGSDGGALAVAERPHNLKEAQAVHMYTRERQAAGRPAISSKPWPWL